MTEESDPMWFETDEGIQDEPELAEWAQTKNFADPATMAKSYRALEEKMGADYRLPNDLTRLDEDQKAELITKTKALRNIPEKPEDYVIEIAEGIQKDEAFIGAFKALAHERGLSASDAQALADFYNTANEGAREKFNAQQEKESAEAETKFRMKHGGNFEKVMKGIDIARYEVAKDLGLLYRIEGEEKPHSKLDEALDFQDVNGRKLGNNPAVLDLLDMVYRKLYKGSVPIPGMQEPGAGGGGAFSDDFYRNPMQGSAVPK